MSVGTDPMTGYMVAWRLLHRSEQLRAHAKNKRAKVDSLKETMEQEKVLFGGAQSVAQSGQTSKTGDDTRIKLSDLMTKLKQLQGNSDQAGGTAGQAQTVVAVERRQTDVTINYRVLEKVDGLVVRNQHLAETDRYAFEFQDGSTFKITDKWTGKSTTIWGDPHVYTSDQGEQVQGEFSDLKDSDQYTSLVLEDGSRVTFTAPDNAMIQAVDIVKGNQHLHGTGAGSSDWGKGQDLFAQQVDGDAAHVSSLVPMGDVVYAGGDGNDWFSAAGKLVWGITTGPRVTSRPYAILDVSVRQVEEQALFAQTVNWQA